MDLRAKRWGIVVPMVLCLSVICGFVLAEEENVGPYVMRAASLGDTSPPRIDGRLDDPAWAKAIPVDGFIQKEPYFGQPASEDTEVRIVYDRTHLYVATRCYSEPDKTVKYLSRRDGAYSSDAFAIFIDSRHDHRTGYKFACNPLGVQQDSYRYDDNEKDISWDGFWRCKTYMDSLGWNAEFEIPFNNLRFSNKTIQVWGINFERWFRNGESTSWKPIHPDDGGLWKMSSLGHLVGIEDIRQGKHLEIYPYATAWMSQYREEKANSRSDVGFDVKYGITTNLRANFTLNPDFAQVEADRVEINLTRFPTRLSEKRPFFMEGNSVFSTPLELFYSRRIGSRGDILWGAKLNGKAGRYTLGFLGAQAGDWNYFGLAGRKKSKEEASYSVFRVSQDIFRNSNVGILMANKDWADTYSRVAGIDARLNFLGHYVASGQIAQAWNPDLSKNDRAYTFELDRRTDLFRVRFSTQRMEPEFDANATGYIRKERHRGEKSADFEVEYRPRTQALGLKQVFVGYEGSLSQGLYTDAYFTEWKQDNPALSIGPEFKEDLVSWWHDTWFGMEFRPDLLLGSVQVWYDYGKSVELTDVFRAKSFGASMSTQGYRRLSGGMSFRSSDYYNFAQKYVGTSRSIGLSGAARPDDHLNLYLDANYVQSFDPQGGTDGRFWTGSVRTTYLLNRDVFLRLFAQTGVNRTYYDRVETHRMYLVSALLGWEFLPRSNVFLAYNEDRGTSGTHFRLNNRALVAKVSYLWSL